MTTIAKALLEWTSVSDRIISVRLWSKHIKTTLLQVHAPTNDAENELKENCYDQLQKVVESSPQYGMKKLVLGDAKAKVVGEKGIEGQ
jgi:hypothetical protein